MCATPRVRSRWAAATPGRPSRLRSASAYSLPLQALVKLTSATADEAGAVAFLRPSAGFMVHYVLPSREQFNMSCGVYPCYLRLDNSGWGHVYSLRHFTRRTMICFFARYRLDRKSTRL